MLRSTPLAATTRPPVAAGQSPSAAAPDASLASARNLSTSLLIFTAARSTHPAPPPAVCACRSRSSTRRNRNSESSSARSLLSFTIFLNRPQHSAPQTRLPHGNIFQPAQGLQSRRFFTQRALRYT